ncbi:MAG: DRTGG domain-containing protein, partial [Deltaproteobacteria bacterium]
TSWVTSLRSTNSKPMKLLHIKEILKADVLVGAEKLESEIDAGTASDLMSDMLRGPTNDTVLLTGLNNLQVIRSSVISGVAAVVLVRDKKPTADMISHATEHNLPVLTTPYTMYSACGRLFREGLRGVENRGSDRASAEEG